MTKVFDLGEIDLSAVISKVVSAVANFDSTTSVENNLVDAFAAAAEVATFNLRTEREWREPELHRQKQKALMNAIGNAHQEIIGQLDGFNSYPASAANPMPDVVGKRGKQQIFAEIKNKHNTMNSRSSEATFHSMAGFSASKQFKDYVGIVVQIISPVPAPGEKMWIEFAPGRSISPRKNLLKMSGRVFYAIATDPMKRQPAIDFDAYEDLSKWPSWQAIDLMVEIFLKELEKQTNSKTPKWVKELFSNGIG
jgi:hypothetical protein